MKRLPASTTDATKISDHCNEANTAWRPIPWVQDSYSVDEVADVFWDHLPKAKSGKGQENRRYTGWGSKTKLGLALTIRRLGAGLVTTDEEANK